VRIGPSRQDGKIGDLARRDRDLLELQLDVQLRTGCADDSSLDDIACGPDHVNALAGLQCDQRIADS
jgi:hypothetical protein